MDKLGIDKIYIIISKEFEPERYAYLTSYFNKYPDIDVVFFEASYINRDENLIDYSKYGSSLKKREIMLLEGYRRLFKHILTNTNYQYVFILESDVLFVDNFLEILTDYIKQWKALNTSRSMVFTGNGCNLKPNVSNKVSTNLYKENWSRCTDSMLMTRESIIYFYNHLENNIINNPIDHILVYGDSAIVSYYAEPHIIIQGSQNGTYASTIQC